MKEKGGQHGKNVTFSEEVKPAQTPKTRIDLYNKRRQSLHPHQLRRMSSPANKFHKQSYPSALEPLKGWELLRVAYGVDSGFLKYW